MSPAYWLEPLRFDRQSEHLPSPATYAVVTMLRKSDIASLLSSETKSSTPCSTMKGGKSKFELESHG